MNVQHPGYINHTTHKYSSHTNGAYGMATQGPSLGSFIHELHDFKDISGENIITL